MEHTIETTDQLELRFNADGLLPAVAVDHRSNAVLMVAWMNQAAFDKTLETGTAHYFSRSRNTLWQKGETSGHIQNIVEICVDCDQDTVLLKVDMDGKPACHTQQTSCFYRVIQQGQNGTAVLRKTLT